MSDISDMDWAQHIKMDYAQNLRKDTNTGKIKTLRKFLQDKACSFSRRCIYYFMQKFDQIIELSIILYEIIRNSMNQ